MGMDSIWSFMDIIFAGAGLYALYACYIMKVKGEITTSLLMSKDVDIRKCKDIEGYKRFVLPKLLIFALSAVLCGGVGLVSTYVVPIPNEVYYAAMGLFFVVLIWYAYQTKKGIALFW